MMRLTNLRLSVMVGLTVAACAKAESGVGYPAEAGPDGVAGTQSGGAAGTASGGAAGGGGTATGGAAGSSGGAAGSAGDAGQDVSLDGSDASDADYSDAKPDAIVTLPGLQGFWRFEETLGPVFDVSGNGLHGSVQGTGITRGSTGQVGKAVSLSGTDGAVKIPSSPKLDFVSAATIELWIKLSSVTLGTILSRGTGSNDAHVRIKTQSGNLNISFGKSGQTPVTLISATNVIGTQWSHVAVVNDGSQLRLYVDGKLNQSGTGGGLASSAQDLYLGKSAASDTSFNGNLDEVRWFDVVRTEQEICADAGGTWATTESGFICQ